MKLLTPRDWKAYELIDSGDGEKLERFGKYVLRRPEPQAVWSKSMPESDWESMAHAQFVQEGSHSGGWKRFKPMQDQWYIEYRYKGMNLAFRLGLTGFKHVGIFPEQAVNWNFIYESCLKLEQPKVLNLFAYTGGASLAARSGGADVIHCDSIKNVLNWANANMQASDLTDIRWLLEDAFKFVKREARRERVYHGIILDPPAWGHGPKGEKWKLEDMVNELTEYVSKILHPNQHFMVFNSYSLGFSPLVLENLVKSHFSPSMTADMESGELYMAERSGRKLPMGIFSRMYHGPEEAK
ncbi:class I SAM-dependent methyltransferase [Pontibacter sp. G13]|uniref:class I SAM-dependent methyltransferase n=1 Tax=Pontibacter sp. G13 TaxID=3074898 RepID=UPI00288B328D|nr:class I SAM-dependent methyltransferase [Pontibacter sp. G13]WNJ16160.1 class I SAM-dependent methyltransferase [Pontibacter sp. G13]